MEDPLQRRLKMMRERCLGSFLIARLTRLENVEMLADRADHARCRRSDVETDHRNIVFQPPRRRLDHRVAQRSDDAAVKLLLQFLHRIHTFFRAVDLQLFEQRVMHVDQSGDQASGGNPEGDTSENSEPVLVSTNDGDDANVLEPEANEGDGAVD